MGRIAAARGDSEQKRDHAADAIVELESVVDDLKEIVDLLEKEEGAGK